MKKLLIIPMVLSLIIFSLYHEDVGGMDKTQKGKVEVAAKIHIEEEILNIFNNSKNEINTTVETNESNATVEKEFSVEIKGELKTIKESILTLKAKVSNADNLDACSYLWYENEQVIDMGITLQQAFEKGEHNITLVVFDGSGKKINKSLIVRAYDYYRVEKFNYDPHYGNLLYVEREIMNHKGQYLLYDNGTYSKEYSRYDESNNILERSVEYYLFPNENRKTVYTYDSKGNRLTTQTFDFTGESVYYALNSYDEDGVISDTKYGIDSDNLEENMYTYGSGEIIYEEIYTEGKVYAKQHEDVIELNDNGQVIYEERYYGEYKDVNKMTYNEENKLVKQENISTSSYNSRSNIIEYDKEGNAINIERKYELDGQNSCHYTTNATYTKQGMTKSSVSTILAGSCPYIDEVKRVYTYNAEGSVSNIKAGMSDEDGGFNTLVVLKQYTDELDI